jgi:hypothetical protein
MTKTSATKKVDKTPVKGYRVGRPVNDKSFSRKYRTIMSVSDLNKSTKSLWHTGMNSSEWFSYKGTILWTFQQHGVHEFFVSNPAVSSVDLIVEKKCPASRDPIIIDDAVDLELNFKKNEEMEVYSKIKSAIDLLGPGKQRKSKKLEARVRHLEREGKINESKSDILRAFESKEKNRSEKCDLFDSRLEKCATVVAKTFNEQYLRDYEQLLVACKFREFFFRVDERESNKCVGQTKCIQALQEIQLARFVSTLNFDINLRHFDMLLKKYEGVGGVMDDETKKYYLYASFKFTDYPPTFMNSVEAFVNFEKIAPASAKLSFDKYLNEIKKIHQQSNLEDMMDANSGVNASSNQDQLAVLKHSTKIAKKNKPVDKAALKCFTCGQKGHFRGAPECKGSKKKSKTSSSDTSEEAPLNLEAEFTKGSGKGK